MAPKWVASPSRSRFGRPSAVHRIRDRLARGARTRPPGSRAGQPVTDDPLGGRRAAQAAARQPIQEAAGPRTSPRSPAPSAGAGSRTGMGERSRGRPADGAKPLPAVRQAEQGEAGQRGEAEGEGAVAVQEIGRLLAGLAQIVAQRRAGQDALGPIPVLLPVLIETANTSPCRSMSMLLRANPARARRSRADRAAFREGTVTEAKVLSDIMFSVPRGGPRRGRPRS